MIEPEHYLPELVDEARKLALDLLRSSEALVESLPTQQRRDFVVMSALVFALAGKIAEMAKGSSAQAAIGIEVVHGLLGVAVRQGMASQQDNDPEPPGAA